MAKDRRILVTGADGFIGSSAVNWLRFNGLDVRECSRREADLRDPQDVARLMQNAKPDVIIHLATASQAGRDTGWEVVRDEHLMLTNLAKSMPTHTILVHAGSMAEYGQSGILDETHFCTPNTAYGCAKLKASYACANWRQKHSLDIRVARLFGVYGPGEAPHRLVPSLISKLRRGQKVALSDGQQVRDFIHVDDVVSMLWTYASLEETSEALVNIGTGMGVSVRHVCEEVARAMNRSYALLDFGAHPRRLVDEDCIVAKIDRLSSFATPPEQLWLSPPAVDLLVEQFLATTPF
jgi:nucleoside-diphosphate-sugar epimerase